MNKVSYSTRSALLLALLGAGTVFVACGDGAGLIYPPDGGSTSTGGGGGDATTTADATVTASVTSSTGTGGTAPATLTWVAEFDATKGQLPEGIALNAAEDTAYVGFAATGQIVKVSLADGKVSDFGTVPMPPANKGFVLGLAFDKDGALYVGAASFDAAAYQAGIYKIPAAGGAGVLFAKDATMTVPNGLVFDKNGALFVTDSASGSIFKIDTAGVAAKWSSDAVIAGGTASKCASGLGFPLGANGIALSNGAFYVANTDKASVVKIPVMADGTAGAASAFAATDCAALGGADGLAVDTDGTLLIAANGINSIVRVGTDGKTSVVVAKDKLDSPASVAIGTKPEKNLFITNAAFTSAQTPGGMPKPGLLKFPLGG
ncbi:MAG: SMP-30/gluconolactonase/LRE family protein [Byssovorax sp.]